eukprot:TRINITY_DN3820_c0_g1_i13.p1 TRINITY_DN3820_c0_g1~~TRINITY_DN3820_c0_g1_i13.p1  ORF type:complete len:204 (+),score=39.82 TRINITY_DN3820_c0_g1_i13:1547-2158(+)
MILGEPLGPNHSVRMEVGIEGCLHIEFEYERTRYHIQDVILGRIFFPLVRLNIKYMELCLVRKETTGDPPVLDESHNITKFEIMDGSPVKAELLPVRVFLGAFPLTPTYKNVHGQFTVRYFLNMVLVDEEDRRYFKQTDIVFWRQTPEKLTNDFVPLGFVPNYPAKRRRYKKRREENTKPILKGEDHPTQHNSTDDEESYDYN